MTKSEVQKIAELARISLTDDELERYAGELSSILDYIAKLNEVDTDDVSITSQVTGLSNIFREDIVEECNLKDELIAQAPDTEDRGVKVKSVF
ncbi:MAG: Aspartyl/glutamyl-tRNA(Asn/Gln) amidotransferase subunit C [Parcubacteria group bacterium GW2011_GWC2_44_17]|uniref:Aspartyl/glutamyl-tRNA(Asn/Gln) amidotransferase subunit C n=1 Tax=Candidatus Jacksonbacteria bacterium RIFCSPLOWO2_02_FULL_44_20 TaxID=1798460 RepID=A0A1G2A9E5_9BACT|nr:MAG: Aspartyl/glutamyl-tRNA(Asn/Gln) amidotransferase subunit C [Parcubacteria group bacterium GW2011_GWC2_44_17]KKT50563.1 MAG: Aspartyl/glutamyl-tRNA(Asn/Gln) amidotransferase subunit C [Parcubacteria group bacterium GW2011_GWF2_44_17]OGY69426.1 MAG: asparaginyl/glutamyl-tRNA amidotransferase subunit C [Candidatus Jacksonbacteria bacterium RIFCSPHIGHO2_02_FULL_44_25]OGY71372.1 MAG: asparaginyl/glutamyl-tRNA amidotransferase subunit C [Candidatus Jacksonbacteria bacterium RIFCSPHIGHO2_12_FUL